MKLLKKLGTKQIIGNVGAAIKESCENDGDSVDLYTLGGIANGVKTGSGTYGDWTALVGTFEAVNMLTGEEMASTQCFVQEPIESMLTTAISEHGEVEFVVKLIGKRRDDLERGYEYNLEPVLQPKKDDRLSNVRGLISNTVNALEAPAPVKKTRAKKA